MGAPTATELLGAWERGLFQSPEQRAITLLELVSANARAEQLVELPIGHRDACLLNLREAIFGNRFDAQVDCPQCNIRLELDFSVADVRVPPRLFQDETMVLERSGSQLHFRLPNSHDLMLLAETPPGDVTACERFLLNRCLVKRAPDKARAPVCELTAEVAEAISDRMTRADPQANVQLALTCPACSHRWEAPLDIASYLWTELHAHSVRLLREVHTLASAYSWRESDILAMSPSRRQTYLELIGHE
jgi:hypothetical protein